MRRPRQRSHPPPSARLLAVRALRDVQRSRGFSNRALGHQLERHLDLDPRDRGLATTLVYGVLRHRTRLDAHIDAHARKPGGLKGEIRELLRVATFEMLELQRPPAIAITEVTKLVRQLDRSGRMAGVAQGVLGSVARTAAERDAELEQGDPVDVLCRRWSIPSWLAQRWVQRLGAPRALHRARALAEPPAIDLRIDLHRSDPQTVLERLKAEAPDASIEVVPDQPQALRVRGGGDLFHGPLHGEGLISVQGLGAQQAVRLLDPAPGQRILDACAGMGVKALQLAEHMQRRGTIVAADLDADQLERLDEIRVRGGLDVATLSLSVVQADLAAPPHDGLDELDELDAKPFDAVLLDVPCTGLGNLARHPEIRWHRQPSDIPERAALQRRLLHRSLRRVRPGGTLVYAACTFEPEEGPDVIAHAVTDEGVALEAERTFTPEDDQMEGFYVARLRRE